MMLCMCWDDQEVMNQSGEAPGQCGTTGAAEMAQEAGVKKLVLVHMGPALSAQEPFYNAYLAMQRIYQGDIVFSEELLRIDL
jgi:ribonuclease BN (tRNA processing enzyme)